jgi:hypothetical protein
MQVDVSHDDFLFRIPIGSISTKFDLEKTSESDNNTFQLILERHAKKSEDIVNVCGVYTDILVVSFIENF